MAMKTQDPAWRRQQTPETLKTVDRLIQQQAVATIRKEIAELAKERLFRQVATGKP